MASTFEGLEVVDSESIRPNKRNNKAYNMSEKGMKFKGIHVMQ